MSEQELAGTFGWEDEYLSGNLTWWMKLKTQGWVLFDQPWSSQYAKVTNKITGLKS